MSDDERMLLVYPIFSDLLWAGGFDALAILRSIFLGAVLGACAVQLLRDNSPIVSVFVAASAVITLADLVFWLIGLGSVIALLDG